MGNYPLEIEFSSYCTLSCKSCINQDFQERFFLSKENFDIILEFLLKNNNQISFVDIGGIGDAFTHPDILYFLKEIKEKFTGIPLNLNFSQKGQRITQEHIDMFLEMKSVGIELDFFIGIFSIRESVYKYLSGGDSLKRVINFTKQLHRLGFQVSLELLNNYFSHQEYEKFYQICESIGCSGSIKNIANFGGSLDTKLSYLFGYNNKYENEDHIRANNKDIDIRYKHEKCGNIPYISASGKVLACNYLQGYNDGRGKIATVADLNNMGLKNIFEKSYDIAFSKACENCSLFTMPEEWNANDYYIEEDGSIIRDVTLVKLYPYEKAEDIIFLFYNDKEFISDLLKDNANINKHEKIDFLFILELCSRVYNMNFSAFFEELLASWGLEPVYAKFNQVICVQGDISEKGISKFCKDNEVEPIEFYLFAFVNKLISKERFLSIIITLMRFAIANKNATNLAYIVLLKDKLLDKNISNTYGEEIVKAYYKMFSK